MHIGSLPLLLWFPFAALLPAQDPATLAAPPPRAEEIAVLDLGRKELNGYARHCFDSGYPARAREVWFEVIGEYDRDDEAARQGLGYRRHGAVWQLDPAFEPPAADALDLAAAKNLTRRFDVVCKKLGHAHRDAAEQLAAAGATARAEYHFQRALRFLPDDPKVASASGLQQFEGITGSAVDLTILRRSRLMDRAIARLSEQQFAVEDSASRLAVLDQGGMPYVAQKSANFTIYGDWEPEVLREAAVWAERALLFCDEAFEGTIRPGARSKGRRQFVFLRDKATWVRLIEANVATIGRSHAEFLVENAAAGLIGELHTAGFGQLETVFDLAVRWVVHDYTAFGTDALQEGIGHAVVGMFFGRNLVFAVAQPEQQRTVAARSAAKLLLPDIDTWMELATEIAWSRTSTPAAKLPLLQASSFPTDGRIKAWSFCDYLLRRDPLLLKHLDATRSKAQNEREVEGEFQHRAGLPVVLLEDGWRRFWTEDSAIKRAILQQSTPLEAASRDAPKWLAAFNAVRQDLGQKPVGWSSQLSVDCQQHADYLAENSDQRGPRAEHTQLAGKEGFSNAGRSFAQTAVVFTGRDAQKELEQALLLPGYRDAILNANIDTVGLFARPGIVVLDGRRGRLPSTTAMTVTYPVAGDNGRAKEPVPNAVAVDLLGPEVEQLLARNGRSKQKQVGLPLSLHLYFADLADVRCEVTVGGEALAGWLVRGSGSIGRSSAPGLWVFYPAEPLPRGKDITATWHRGSERNSVTFVAR